MQSNRASELHLTISYIKFLRIEQILGGKILMLDISNQTVAQWPAAQDITGIRTSLGFIYIIISRFKKPTKINQFFSHSLVINTEQMVLAIKMTVKMNFLGSTVDIQRLRLRPLRKPVGVRPSSCTINDFQLRPCEGSSNPDTVFIINNHLLTYKPDR